MSATPSDPLEIAVAFLASVCDGAVSDDNHGFNGADAIFGHSLAGQVGHWSPKQRATARMLVQKYRRQVLAATGIDVAAIQTFEVPAASATSIPAAPSQSSASAGVLGPGGAIARKLPGYEDRPAQLAMAALVERCIARNEDAAIEAGTGTGKSLGYLVPAILSGKKTIVSTADKNLQDQLREKDLPFLQSVMPRPFTFAVMKGRANYLCKWRIGKVLDQAQRVEPAFLAVTMERSADAARANQQVWNLLLEWHAATASGDLDTLTFDLPAEIRTEVTVTSEECLGKQCPLYEACFVERAKARAKEADVIVVNHALLVRDLAIRAVSDGQAHVLPDADVCVVDEAHRLEACAIDALGGEITANRWRRLAKKIEALTVGHQEMKVAAAAVVLPATTDVERALQEQARNRLARAETLWLAKAAPVGDFLLQALETIKRRMDDGRVTTQRLGDESALAMAAAMLRMLGQALREAAPDWLTDDERKSWGKLCEQLGKLADDTQAAASPSDEGIVRYAQVEGLRTRYERAVLHVKPIDVTEALGETLFGGGYTSVICTSATLADGDGFGHWRTRVGLDDARELAVPSPFDYATHALLYLPADERALDSSQWRGGHEQTYFDALAEEIFRLLAASAGRAFCLFTSNTALREVYDRLRYRLSYTVLRQGDAPRGVLLSQFKRDESSVLFATRSFFEGVDVQGSALSLVVVDKLPFAPPDDPLWEAQCAAVNARTGDRWAWFGELAIPAATITLKQATGRLIRAKTDTGVMAILDGRLISKRYGATILRALPPAPITRDLADVEAFFRR